MCDLITNTIEHDKPIKYKITRKMPIVIYRNSIITFKWIKIFTNKKRCDNDKNNKRREIIIGCIINNKIPSKYYKYSLEWNNLKNSINLYINKLCEIKNINTCNNIICVHKASRCNNYDFKIIINETEIYNVEFKFNAITVCDAPQFVSPMKPSKYLNKNFESWFYDNYLNKIATYGNLEMPIKEEYLKKIHNNKVECMKQFKEKYDLDEKFKKYCKNINNEAIKKFIEMTEINMEKLSKYLLESQKEKVYMCYKENKLYLDTIDNKLYKIKNLFKKEDTNYIYQTEAGMKLEIKLRFKNGCGLQFPAFQIKRRIPSVKELKKICDNNNIKSPKLKKDICSILNENNIIY